MLSKEKLDAIAVMIGIDADVFAQAYSDEKEIDLEIPKGRFLTEEKEGVLLDNHGKRKYDEGVSKSRKDSYDGKSKEDFVKEIKDAALEEAKVKPNEKIAELENSLNSLRKTITSKDKDYEALKESVNGERNMLKAQSYIPELSESLGINKSEAVGLILGGHEVIDGEVYKNGEVLRNSMQEAINLESFVRDSVSKRKWGVTPHGRGGGSGASSQKQNNSSLPKTIEEYEAVIKSRNLHAGSEEAQSLLVEAAKESPSILG